VARRINTRTRVQELPSTSQPGERDPAPGGPVSPSELVQFDPNAPIRTPQEAVVQAEIDPAGTWAPEEGLLAAKEELKTRLGGLLGRVADAQALSAPGDSEQGNIVGWAVGEKVTGDSFTGEMAVKVLVIEKKPRGTVSRDSQIPERINGYPTDVEEVGEITSLGYMGRYRPAFGGTSIGHYQITAGTLGCLVVTQDDKLCILSNNHVLADSNNARKGDAILQPGPADGGRNPEDRIAALEDFVAIRFEGENAVDAAIALTNFRFVSANLETKALNPTPVVARVQLTVRKWGRTTGPTLGDVVGVSADIRVRYGNRVALFTNQIQIRGRDNTRFSREGDSGSLIVSAGTYQPVGLLFSGGDYDTFANPIAAVMGALRIKRFLVSANV
jgi:hypothetical protein